MKKLILLLVLLSVTGCWWDKKTPTTPVPIPVEPAPTQPAPVLNDLDRGLAQAQKENKPIYLFLTEDSCIYCRRMKKSVFPEVNMTGYVFVETKDVNLHQKFKVEAFPTSVKLDKSGKEISRVVGYMNARDLSLWLK